jgi:hypothetical protein
MKGTRSIPYYSKTISKHRNKAEVAANNHNKVLFGSVRKEDK